MLFTKIKKFLILVNRQHVCISTALSESTDVSPHSGMKNRPQAVWLKACSECLGYLFQIMAGIAILIPTRSRQAYSKQACLWDLAQIIYIAFITQMVWVI